MHPHHTGPVVVALALAVGCAATTAIGGASPSPALAASRASSTPAMPSGAQAVRLFDALAARGGLWQRGRGNEDGLLAWDESFVLMAYLEMYQATGKTVYLTRFARHAEALLLRTDQARGVADWAARSGPVWSAGSRYCFAHLVVLGTDGAPLAELVADRVGRNDTVEVELADGTAGTLVVRVWADAGRVAETFPGLSADPSSSAYWADAVDRGSRLVRVSPLRRPGASIAPSPLARRRLDPYRVVYAAHTGLIAVPLARFARVVRARPALAGRFGGRASRYLRAAQRAVAFHDAEFTVVGSRGYYRYPVDAPLAYAGAGLPHNQNLLMGRALLELWRATGDEDCRGRAELIARHFKSGLSQTIHNGYRWTYWWGWGGHGREASPTPSVEATSDLRLTNWEDVVHGALDVDFVCDAAESPDALGGAFTEADLVRFGNTVLVGMRAPGGFKGRVFADPSGIKAHNTLVATRWIRLGRANRGLFETLERIARARLPRDEPSGWGLYVAATAARLRLGYESRLYQAPRPPSVRFVSPGDAVGDDQLAVRVVTGRGVKSLVLWVDLVSPSNAPLVGPGLWAVPLSSLTPGQHRIDVVALDSAGRAGAAAKEIEVPPADGGPDARATSSRAR